MTNYDWIVFSVSLRLLDKSNNQIITSMHLQAKKTRCFLRRLNLQQQFGRVPLEPASQSCWSKTLIYTWVGSSPSQGESGQRLIDRYNLLLSYFSQEKLIWSLYLLSASFIQFWAVTYLKWAWLRPMDFVILWIYQSNIVVSFPVKNTFIFRHVSGWCVTSSVLEIKGSRGRRWRLQSTTSGTTIESPPSWWDYVAYSYPCSLTTFYYIVVGKHKKVDTKLLKK